MNSVDLSYLGRPTGKQAARLLQEIRAKHPQCKSSCSALIVEMSRTKDIKDLRKIVDLLGCLQCRRSICRLESLVTRLSPLVAMPEGDWGVHSPERDLIGDALVALGRIDSRKSQGVLARVLRSSRNPIIRADAMEAMAFGRKYHPRLVWPYVSSDKSIPEILSAIYALEFKCSLLKPAKVAVHVLPLLQHTYPLVRAYTISLLGNNPAHRKLIESMEHDPDGGVRDQVAGALRWIDMI